MNYTDFLESKRHVDTFNGFKPVWMPDFLFDFQAHLTDYAIRKGQAALFEGCGLGKSPQQLVIAENLVRKTNKNVLIVAPLAVSFQTVREGKKFGVEVTKTSDGKAAKGITITNYERLDRYDPNEFVGIICDECFPAGTMVDTPLGKRKIEDIEFGDIIYNASGIDSVVGTRRKEVQYGVKIKTDSTKEIISSPNHPFLTQRGWVSSQDLEPGDSILQTKEAVRMVRGYISSVPSHNIGIDSFLREVLLSEMEDETASAQSEGIHSRRIEEKRTKIRCMVGARHAAGEGGEGPYRRVESIHEARGADKDFKSIKGNESCTFRAWRKRKGHDKASADFNGCLERWVGSRVEYIVGKKDSRFSNVLQSRLREYRNKSRYRSGWKFSPESPGTRREEGQETGFTRVEGIEILERGNPELERFREKNGKLYFYDLEALRHPSFSVEGLVVHNSSAIKHMKSKRKWIVTEFMKKVQYRYLFTATPAPNDYIELGTSSEALGGMGHMDMLSKFFKNAQNSINPTRTHGGKVLDGAKFYLKPHAKRDFWRWICSWARAIRKPSDLGFSDEKFELPGLETVETIVKASRPLDGMLFSLPAVGLKQQREERRATIDARCDEVVKKVDGHDSSIVWCHLNDEGDRLEKIVPDSVQVSGKDSDDLKEEKFLAFADGRVKRLITKPSIFGFGMNAQHCAHMTFFPSHSWEQFHQGVRRCYRFGQKRKVRVDIISTEGEVLVLNNHHRKEAQAEQMFEQLVKEMNNELKIQQDESMPYKTEKPSWL